MSNPALQDGVGRQPITNDFRAAAISALHLAQLKRLSIGRGADADNRQNHGDLSHRHPTLVGRPDRHVAIRPQRFGRFVQRLLALPVARGEGPKPGAGVRCFALRACDTRIVDPILATGLARTANPPERAGHYPRKSGLAELPCLLRVDEEALAGRRGAGDAAREDAAGEPAGGDQFAGENLD